MLGSAFLCQTGQFRSNQIFVCDMSALCGKSTTEVLHVFIPTILLQDLHTKELHWVSRVSFCVDGANLTQMYTIRFSVLSFNL